jgi:hypothetical protein
VLINGVDFCQRFINARSTGRSDGHTHIEGVSPFDVFQWRAEIGRMHNGVILERQFTAVHVSSRFVFMVRFLCNFETNRSLAKTSPVFAEPF